jgi:hypothetical protein
LDFRYFESIRKFANIFETQDPARTAGMVTTVTPETTEVTPATAATSEKAATLENM